MRNIKLLIAYEGTNYLGWQKTEKGPSIEQAVELALQRILQHSVFLQAASRTDAGVHANGQVVNFFTQNAIKPSNLRLSLNRLLPKDIRVLEAAEAPASFHPTLDCQEKEYVYDICFGCTQMPKRRRFSWHYPHYLQIGEMKRAAENFLGTHNFEAFCNGRKDAAYASTIRTIREIKLVETSSSTLLIAIRGTNFLYKMVRNIVGTLVYVGAQKMPADSIPAIIDGKDRTCAGITAPAHGLTLSQVFYNAKAN